LLSRRDWSLFPADLHPRPKLILSAYKYNQLAFILPVN
jgi:hypothetical protein